MICPILIYGDPLLEQVCAPVENFGVTLTSLIKDMKETCAAANGIGLAAPQIGVLVRVIVIKRGEEYTALVNPRIAAQNGIQDLEEGCLSIPGWKGMMRRPDMVAIDAFDIEGRPMKMVGTGILAACLCHEIDHLDGRLFIHYLGEKHCKLAKAHVERRTAQTNVPPYKDLTGAVLEKSDLKTAIEFLSERQFNPRGEVTHEEEPFPQDPIAE